MLLGRVEAIEDRTDVLERNAGTGVRHHHLHLAMLDQRPANGNSSRTPKGWRPSHPSRSLLDSKRPAADELGRLLPATALRGIPRAG